MSRVFDPFFTTKDPDKGTGLGLAISKGIEEEFGGELETGIGGWVSGQQFVGTSYYQ